MFRATVLTVVWLFAAGPSASLLCKTWCQPQVAAENGCHHRDTGGGESLGSDDSCDDSLQWAADFLKEDLRHAPAPDASAVVSHARLQIGSTATRFASASNRGRPPFDRDRPQATPLRL